MGGLPACGRAGQVTPPLPPRGQLGPSNVTQVMETQDQFLKFPSPITSSPIPKRGARRVDKWKAGGEWIGEEMGWGGVK